MFVNPCLCVVDIRFEVGYVLLRLQIVLILFVIARIIINSLGI